MEQSRWSTNVIERIIWGLKWGAGLTVLYVPVAVVREQAFNNGSVSFDATFLLAVLGLVCVGAGVGVVVGLLRPIPAYGVWGASIIGVIVFDGLVLVAFRDLDMWNLGFIGPVFTLCFISLVGGVAGGCLYYIFND